MKELIVFTNSGKTYHFKNVSEFGFTTGGFKFKYLGESTKVLREAVFNYDSVAGYDLSDQA